MKNYISELFSFREIIVLFYFRLMLNLYLILYITILVLENFCYVMIDDRFFFNFFLDFETSSKVFGLNLCPY